MFVEYFNDLNSLSMSAASRIASAVHEAVKLRGKASVAISGGSTPKTMFELMSSAHYADKFPWGQVHFFQVDERMVSRDDLLSNWRMAELALFSKVPVPSSNLHPMPVVGETPAAMAAAYHKELEDFFAASAAGADSSLHTFDVMQMGMGDDGHTASLFPWTPQVEVSDRWVVSTDAPLHIEPKVPRMTLTYPCLNKARLAIFLVKGRAALLEEVMMRKGIACPHPAGRLEGVPEEWLATRQ